MIIALQNALLPLKWPQECIINELFLEFGCLSRLAAKQEEKIHV